ncbi:MAG: hypothetical protein KDK70_26770 [Myxococcales bacterium]|nr:hypothetical protein [Myxococcales bacterium]
MYSTAQIISAFDDSTGLVLAAGAAVFAGAYIQYIEGIRLGFRHKTHAIPVIANMYFFAHDLVFIGLFGRWFFEIGHWSYMMFWGALVVFSGLEVVVHYQTLRFSHRELMPWASRRGFIAGYVALQLAVLGVFLLLFLVLDDELFLIHFGITEVLSNVFNIPLLMSRGNRKGQSLTLALGLLLGSNVGFFFLFLPALSPAFTVPWVRTVGVLVTAANLVYIGLLLRARPYRP